MSLPAPGAAQSRLPLVVIVGPTAAGKTELSIALAERIGGEIVSADSRLFYRGMDIGTAKPSLEERRRAPHHLIDIAEPDETWNLAQFQRAAADAIRAIHQRRRTPLLVGGTGQYVRAVTEGWQPPPQAPDMRLRAAVEAWGRRLGPAELHRRLASLDPQAAARIEPGNLRRSVRALEVIFLTGRRFSEQSLRRAAPYRGLMIGLNRPRPELYARIDARIEAMLAAGWLDEVRRLLARGYTMDLPSLSAIGYHELSLHLAGVLSYPAAVAEIKRCSRVFVRRQANWFKINDPSIHWFMAGPETLQAVEALVASFLGEAPEQFDEFD
jgi:tRNA dimethylallyltransferase